MIASLHPFRQQFQPRQETPPFRMLFALLKVLKENLGVYRLWREPVFAREPPWCVVAKLLLRIFECDANPLHLRLALAQPRFRLSIFARLCCPIWSHTYDWGIFR